MNNISIIVFITLAYHICAYITSNRPTAMLYIPGAEAKWLMGTGRGEELKESLQRNCSVSDANCMQISIKYVPS